MLARRMPSPKPEKKAKNDMTEVSKGPDRADYLNRLEVSICNTKRALVGGTEIH